MKKKAQTRLLVLIFEIIIGVTAAIIVGKILINAMGVRIHNKPYESYQSLLEKIESTQDGERAPLQIILTNKRSAIVGFPKDKDEAISKYKMRASTGINNLVFEKKYFTGPKGCGNSNKTCICLVYKAEWRDEDPRPGLYHEYFKPDKYVCETIDYDIVGDCVLKITEFGDVGEIETEECSTGFIISRELSYKWRVGEKEQREIFVEKENNLVGICEQLPCLEKTT